MDFQLPIHIKPLSKPIAYGEKILFIGSCFTEHIGNMLLDLKFDVLQNPNGILFDPASVALSLVDYINNQTFTERDIFFYNDVWQSWRHHGKFSSTSKEVLLQRMNDETGYAHKFLKDAKWMVITLGSSFNYRVSQAMPEAVRNKGLVSVANCHRAPANWFQKTLMPIEEIHAALDTAIHRLFQFNNDLQIIFTVSPVRHIRDGVVENNRSKARLIEVVHHLSAKFDRIHYFPAYELVIDVLRDYRFYDIDMVHPNYAATQFVLEHFTEYAMDASTKEIMQQVKQLVIARKHRALHPETPAHKQLLQTQLNKTRELKNRFPHLDLREEENYFEENLR